MKRSFYFHSKKKAYQNKLDWCTPREKYVYIMEKKGTFCKNNYTGRHTVERSLQCFCWAVDCSFHCLWRPCTSTFTVALQWAEPPVRTLGNHTGPPPATVEWMAVLGIWLTSESAFGIIKSFLKNHLMPYPACVKIHFVSSEHLDSTCSLIRLCIFLCFTPS